MNSYILVPVVLYTAWAIYSGYKYVNGRYPWLEQPEIAHRICKYAAILAAVHTKDAGCHPVRKLVQHFNGKDALYEC